MKYLFQLIGLALVLLILLCSVLFYMESKALLQGDFAAFIRQMRTIWLEAKNVSLSFFQTSGIADDAADLLDQGADRLRNSESPAITTATPDQQPGIIVTPTPEPSAAPTQIVLPALTPQPTATPQMIVICTPAP